MKYRIKDEDGREYTVEEAIEEITQDEDIDCVPEVKDDDTTLTNDEILALKKLASVADKLVELITKDVTDEDEEDDNKKELEDDELEEEDDEEVFTDSDEEVIETSEEKKIAHDSKRSFGSNLKTTKRTNDSVQDDINEAWAKRFGGIR